MKKIIQKKPQFEALNQELKEKVEEAIESISIVQKGFTDFLVEHLKKFDSLTSEFIKIERQSLRVKEETEANEKSCKERTIALCEKQEEVNRRQTRVGKRETIVEEDNEIIKKKKKSLEEFEEELIKKNEIIEEKRKKYKVAKPIKG